MADSFLHLQLTAGSLGRNPQRRMLSAQSFLVSSKPKRTWHPRATISSSAAGGVASPHEPAASLSQQRQHLPRVSRYPGLRGDDFRHSLDQQNTALLRVLPGLEFLARSVLSPAAEQVLYLENISSSILVGPDQLPSLHASFVAAAETLGMEAPDLYVRQNPVPNAYTLAISGKKPFVVVHTSLLDLLTPLETQAVLAHELGHLRCDHGVWLTAANVLALGTVSLLPVISGAVEEALMRWARAAELSCDRAALLVAQDASIVISALMKLAGGSRDIANELSVEAFLRQARSYDEATASPIGWYLRNAQTRALSHPLPVLRAREIDRWSTSNQYNELLERGLRG